MNTIWPTTLRTGATRRQFSLGPRDLDAMAFLGKGHFMNGLRRALAEVSGWTGNGPIGPRAVALRGTAATNLDLRMTEAKAGGRVSPLRRWSCWVRTDDDHRIERVRKRWGFDKDTEAVRFVVRAAAEAAGFEVPSWL